MKKGTAMTRETRLSGEVIGLIALLGYVAVLALVYSMRVG
jgi:hypothetical protein